MSSIREQFTRHANRCTFMVAGIPIAEGTSFQVQESGGSSAVRVIGDARAKEHIHNAYSVNWTVGRLVWNRGAVKNFDLTSNLLNIPTFTITAFEGPPGEETSLFEVQDCTLFNRSQSVNANQPISSNLSGEGISLGSDDQDYEETAFAQS